MDDGGEVKIPACHVAELTDFFAAHDRWLFGHACARTRGDRDLAADLVQDTFEAAARPDPRHPAIRPHQALPVRHLRDLVDPPGDHPGPGRPAQRGSGPRTPGPGTRGRARRRAHADRSPAAPGPGPRAHPGRARRRTRPAPLRYDLVPANSRSRPLAGVVFVRLALGRIAPWR